MWMKQSKHSLCLIHFLKRKIQDRSDLKWAKQQHKEMNLVKAYWNAKSSDS